MANKYAHYSKHEEARKELYSRIHTFHKNKLSCIRKTPYDTQGHALKRAKAKGMENQLSAYKCGFCHCWHLTKQDQARKHSHTERQYS